MNSNNDDDGVVRADFEGEEESPLTPTAEEAHDALRTAAVGEALGDKIDREERREALRKLGYRQWTSPDGKVYMAAGETVKEVPPGLYNVGVLQDGSPYFSSIPLRDEKLMRLENSATDEVVAEIQKFWGLKEKFKKMGLLHKRGILLHGPSGTGKSCAIQLLVRDVVERGGVAINFDIPDGYIYATRVFRNIQPETPIVVIMEDLESSLQQGGRGFESKLLNVLDGVEATINHVVYVATTNFPETLGQRIANRPSRFDRRICIPNPDLKARKLYLEFIATEPLDSGELEKWAVDTEGLAYAHLKELYVGVKALERPYEEVLAALKEMGKNISSEDTRAKMGFQRKKPGVIGIG